MWYTVITLIWENWHIDIWNLFSTPHPSPAHLIPTVSTAQFLIIFVSYYCLNYLYYWSHIRETMQYLTFCGWFIVVSIMVSRLTIFLQKGFSLTVEPAVQCRSDNGVKEDFPACQLESLLFRNLWHWKKRNNESEYFVNFLLLEYSIFSLLNIFTTCVLFVIQSKP